MPFSFWEVNLFLILMLLKKYPEIDVVVSCDGPKKIQDTLRRFKNGGPSFDVVSKNIELLREYNQPKAIEVTYTKIHQDYGCSPLDLRTFFKEKFNISNLMIADVISEDSYLDVDKNKKDYLQSRYLITEVLDRQPTSYFCQMGYSNFTINTKGDVYPCQMLGGMDNFKISNVHDDFDNFKEEIFKKSKLYKNRSDKSRYRECNICYLKYFCGDCPASNYITNNTINKTFENCTNLKKEIEEKILQYANNIN